MNKYFNGDFGKYFNVIIEPAIWSTLRMLFFTMLLGCLLGFIISVFLIEYHPQGIKPNRKIYNVLNFIANLIRSFPIIILICAVSPLTRIVVGTTLGEKAAILPLTIAATPFIAKLFEGVYLDVNKQLIQAARAMGGSDIQIIWYVIIKESIPGMISCITLASITYLSATTLAGAVGAGGIGAVALNYGYQSFNDVVLYTAVGILLIMVQILQLCGDKLYKLTITKGK